MEGAVVTGIFSTRARKRRSCCSFDAQSAFYHKFALQRRCFPFNRREFQKCRPARNCQIVDSSEEFIPGNLKCKSPSK
ncbi:hypothetical protein E3N88_23456 [Mikania micrantha]|uniref:Uncharacterized protein n=1 Tax=Mikania micrantha TaxID=192012 RepID=A0A5N6NFW6_9ASTR|nr:hypothetical protein E3N88_23456 [Mikania micrantha]